jgi:hypothetical protein
MVDWCVLARVAWSVGLLRLRSWSVSFDATPRPAGPPPDSGQEAASTIVMTRTTVLRPRCSRADAIRARRRSTTCRHPYVVCRAASVARAHAPGRGRAARGVELALPCRAARSCPRLDRTRSRSDGVARSESHAPPRRWCQSDRERSHAHLWGSKGAMVSVCMQGRWERLHAHH